MKLLFIGGVFDPGYIEEIVNNSKGPIQFAANTLQWMIISGLDYHNGEPVSILNVPFVGSYPKLYSKLVIHGRKWSHSPNAVDYDIGYLNYFGIKFIWRCLVMARGAGKWLKRTRGHKERAIIVYSLNTPLLLAGVVAKKLDPSIHLCVIVPDLPDNTIMGGTVSKFLQFLLSQNNRISYRLIKVADSFVLLTKHMVEPLKVEKRPFVVVEGMVDPEEQLFSESNMGRTEKKIILYTGLLEKRYGIVDLLNAFSQISNPEYELWIRGDGVGISVVQERMRQDPRIKWIDRLSRVELLKLQQNATVLVVLRDNKELSSRYSFPLKMMEYLLSGTPIITRKVLGIPEEYYSYTFAIEDSGAQALAEAIVNICELPVEEWSRIGELARNFVRSQKNYLTQTERIYSLIKNR